MRRLVQRSICAIALFSALLIFCLPVWASVGGAISGTLKDASGSVVAGAVVTLREIDTGLVYHTRTNHMGDYTFPVLPIGHYELDIEAAGFSSYQRKGIRLDTNGALTFEVTLAVGDVAQTIHVADNTIHVETSSTQLGEVIRARQMTAVPLNGRSYTDLLSLQPGVAPATAITSSTVQDVGATILNPSGTLNPGTISVNGHATIL
jgi:Carboxypeptidase regulatory-like domain